MALDRILIDWGDDGYQHAQSDVTGSLREYSVQYLSLIHI